MSEPEADAMPLDASMALADQILADAGWAPVRAVVGVGGTPLANDGRRFAFANLVCGHPPEGSRATYAGKEITKIPQAFAAVFGLDSADYPDTHHEAAAWLVEHVKFPAPMAGNPLSLESLDLGAPSLGADIVAAEDEAGENAGDAAKRISIEPDATHVDDPPAVDLGLDEGRGDCDGEGVASADVPFADAAIDADFSVFGGFDATPIAALEGEDLNLPELPMSEDRQAADCIDEAAMSMLHMLDHPDLLDEKFNLPEHHPEGMARIYGLDDLDRRKQIKIGAVGIVAARLVAGVEALVAEQPGEFAEVQGYVSTHLDKHTGLFNGTDTRAWDRFIALSDARQAIAAIEEHRKSATTFLISADRDAVEAFDPEAGWPD